MPNILQRAADPDTRPGSKTSSHVMLKKMIKNIQKLFIIAVDWTEFQKAIKKTKQQQQKKKQ